MELTRRAGLDAAHAGKSIWTRSHCGIFIGGRSRGEQAEQGAPILFDVCWRPTPYRPGIALDSIIQRHFIMPV
jgi:hypothetical protein